ncbi:unnamed protein product [Menidia menidia]|uniref:(Atlantic silverside) hypothetical protein n=1 Tax=Menidia menidia TaxID=238744 RepID=A0A8S4BCU5_9TELE|nr:unnamed protein product [Menidia menidia]
MSLNGSSPEAWGYTRARFYVSTASFSVLLFFNLLINWTIVRERRLRGQARFVLVFHLLASALVYLGACSVFYCQLHLRAEPSRGACRAMVAVLISSASNILLTLTAMALDRYRAVCHPMSYASACACAEGRWPWLLGALTWMLALAIPLALFLRPGGDPGEDPGGGSRRCGREQLRRGELHKVLFIGACTLLILYSYARILLEGRRLGVLNRRNRAGCRTIALHGAQLAVYLLPNFFNFVVTLLRRNGAITTETKELSALVSFAFFSVAQCVAPIVYGLRKEELLEKLSLRFPCCSRYLKAFLGLTVRPSWKQTQHVARERTLTALTIVSADVSHVPEERGEDGGLPPAAASQDSQSCQSDAV